MSGRRGRPKKIRDANSELEEQRSTISTLTRMAEKKQTQVLQLMKEKAVRPVISSSLNEIKFLIDELKASTELFRKHAGRKSVEAREKELYVEELEDFYAECMGNIQSGPSPQKEVRPSCSRSPSVTSQESRRSRASVSNEAAQKLADQLQRLERKQQELQLAAKQAVLMPRHKETN